ATDDEGADGEASAISGTSRSVGSAMTADIRNTCWRLLKRWCPSRKLSATQKRHHSCAQELPPTTPCATVAHCPVTLSQSRASAVWGPPEFNSPTRFVVRVRATVGAPEQGVSPQRLELAWTSSAH